MRYKKDIPCAFHAPLAGKGTSAVLILWSEPRRSLFQVSAHAKKSTHYRREAGRLLYNDLLVSRHPHPCRAVQDMSGFAAHVRRTLSCSSVTA